MTAILNHLNYSVIFTIGASPYMSLDPTLFVDCKLI